MCAIKGIMLRMENVVRFLPHFLARFLPLALLLWVSACIVVVPRDETLSSRLRDWKILAERGNAEAQYNFGWYLLQSATSAEDEKLALSWFEKASQQGVAEAQFALATMLEQGKGIGAARGISTNARCRNARCRNARCRNAAACAGTLLVSAGCRCGTCRRAVQLGYDLRARGGGSVGRRTGFSMVFFGCCPGIPAGEEGTASGCQTHVGRGACARSGFGEGFS